jgi:hypothetical protein
MNRKIYKCWKIPKIEMAKKQYCTALTETNSKERLIGDCGEYYICGITKHPCVAREIVQTDSQDHPIVKIWGKATIDEERLRYCPAWNLPMDKVKELARFRLEMEVEKSMAKLDNPE